MHEVTMRLNEMSGVGREHFEGSRQYVKRRTTTGRRPAVAPVLNATFPSCSESEDLVYAVSRRKASDAETSKSYEKGVEFFVRSTSKRRRSPIWSNTENKRGWLAADTTTSIVSSKSSPVQRDVCWSSFNTVDFNATEAYVAVADSNTADMDTTYLVTAAHDSSVDCMAVEEECKTVESFLTPSCKAKRGPHDGNPGDDYSQELHWGVRGQRANRNHSGKSARNTKTLVTVTGRTIPNSACSESARPQTPPIDETIYISRMQEESSGTSAGDFFESGPQESMKKSYDGTDVQVGHLSSRDIRRSTDPERSKESWGLNIQLGWHEMMDDFKMCGGRLRQKPKITRPKKIQRSLQAMSLCASLANRKVSHESLLQDYEPQVPKTAVQRVNGLRGLVDMEESDDEEI